MSFRFSPTQDIVVTDFGYLDRYDAAGAGSRTEALYNAAGSSLTETVVPGVDPLENGFRYRSITDLTLKAGKEYDIVRYVPTGDDVQIAFGGDPQPWFLPDPIIIYLGARYKDNSNGVAAPTSTAAGVVGYFGPNFKYRTNGGSTVPEPGSLALLFGPGLSGFALILRRRTVGHPSK